MDKNIIKEFFNNCASSWDAEMIRDTSIIDKILDGAEVSSGKSVLDVACGTGVLFPDYIKRNVLSITGIDISEEMLNIAQQKYSASNIDFICGDIEEIAILKNYDCIMIYNAFPHFPNPEKVIYNLSQMLNPNGTLTVAHGMSRAQLDAHHSGSAKHVSLMLISEDELAEMMSEYLEVTVKISDDKMYQVTGKLK